VVSLQEYELLGAILCFGRIVLKALIRCGSWNVAGPAQKINLLWLFLLEKESCPIPVVGLEPAWQTHSVSAGLAPEDSCYPWRRIVTVGAAPESTNARKKV